MVLGVKLPRRRGYRGPGHGGMAAPWWRPTGHPGRWHCWPRWRRLLLRASCSRPGWGLGLRGGCAGAHRPGPCGRHLADRWVCRRRRGTGGPNGAGRPPATPRAAWRRPIPWRPWAAGLWGGRWAAAWPWLGADGWWCIGAGGGRDPRPGRQLDVGLRRRPQRHLLGAAPRRGGGERATGPPAADWTRTISRQAVA